MGTTLKKNSRGYYNRRTWRRSLFLPLLIFILISTGITGCGSGKTSADDIPSASTADDTEKRDNTPKILIPSADGIKTIDNSVVTIDISHSDQGYIMAAYHGESSNVNIQVTGPDGVTYLYYISERDVYTAMPLSSGNGDYLVCVYENIEGDVYSTVLSETVNVALENEFFPFLYSNQFVYFEKDTKAIQKGAQLAKNCSTDLEVVTAIYNYVTKNTEYDYDKAAAVQSPYYPDVDETLETGKGICFDYSALMCAMLRTQRIPTRLNIGYAQDIYHAWISVYLDSMGWVDNMIQFNGTDWTLMDPTFASTGGEDFHLENDDYILMFQR